MTDSQATCEHNDHNKGPAQCTICNSGFVMSDPTAKAREIGDNIMQKASMIEHYNEGYSGGTQELYDNYHKEVYGLIAVALEAEWEAGRNEVVDRFGHVPADIVIQAKEEGYHCGLEKAAEIADLFDKDLEWERVGDEIAAKILQSAKEGK